MDLSGAYDSVNRPRLWRKLENLGLHPNTMAILRHLYDDNRGLVKVAGKLAAPLPIDCGLRQGDPLSVTLFNLYIHDLPDFINCQVPSAGVPLARCDPPAATVPTSAATTAPNPTTSNAGTAAATTGTAAAPDITSGRLAVLHIVDLGYADDVALMDTDPDRLQRILDAFQTYCNDNGLIINADKSEVVVFTSPRRAAHAGRVWRVVGRDLPRSETFKYLGVTCHERRPPHVAAAEHRLSTVTASYAAVLQHLQRLGARKTPALRRYLYSIVSRPAGDYLRCGGVGYSTP